MQKPLKRVKELIPVLPKKDAKICMEYLEKRDFNSILEIVESDIYKARRNKTEELPDEYISSLIELKGELMNYMSYIYIPDDYGSYDDY